MTNFKLKDYKISVSEQNQRTEKKKNSFHIIFKTTDFAKFFVK